MFNLKHASPLARRVFRPGRFWSEAVTGLLLMMLLSLSAAAQTVTGTISGTVVDPNGAVVAGATVTLTNDQTNEKRDLTTNESGRFSFASVQPGVFTVRIEHQGFETLLRTKVVLSANEGLALGELSLRTGQVTETVTVTSEGQAVEKESSDLTARLTSDQISLISTKGRDITSLLRLIPGTSNDDDIESVGEGFGTNLPNISGQRGRSTVTTIDGLNASEPSGSNKISMTINQDAVAEVKVLRNNYAAEYGNNGGAMITIVSKGGGKDYRGSAYYFLRNESLNANSFFNNKAGLGKALYRHKIPGFNIGGPLPLPRFGEGGPSLMRNKAFFFVSMERPHTVTPTDPVTVTVPTALERIGDFSKSITGVDKNGNPISATVFDPITGGQFAGNVIPSSRINKSGQALLNFFPLPNSAIPTNPGRYVFQKSVDVPKHSYLYRFDFKPTKKDSIYYKAQWWTSDNLGLGTSGWPGGDANRWGIMSHYLYKDNGWSGNWVHILSPRIVNEFNFGMRHDSEGFIAGVGMIEALQRSALNYTAPQLFPQNNHLGTIPRATGWTSVVGTAANINWLDRWGETGNDYVKPAFADNVSFTHGNHSLKFGMYFERLLNSEAPGGQWSGAFNFGTSSSFTTALGSTGFAYANALLGDFNTYTESSARPFTNLSIKSSHWYAQDEWKVNRRFTVSYGMRWVYASPFTQFDKQGSNFDPTKYDPAKAPLLYRPACTVAITIAACPTANRRAYDPRTPGVLLTNTNLVGTFVRNPDGSVVGDLNNGLALGNDPNTPKGYRKTNAVSWEPRLGAAWSINNKTVLRAMGGVYHTVRVGGGTTGGNLVNNPPANRSFTVNFGNIDNLAALLPTALTSPSSLNAVEVNSKRPSIYNFEVGIQREIGFKTVIEVSYVGSQSRHLGERRNINGVPDGARFLDVNPLNRNPFSAVTPNGPCSAPVLTSISDCQHPLGALADNFFRRYQGYADITLASWSGTANYNGLQIQVNRRYTHGFQYGVAYTYSKTFDYSKDDDSGDVNNGRPYRAFNKGVADFDQTHIFTVNYIYDLPRLSGRWNHRFVKTIFDNWQISGTTSYATGKPKTFGSGTGLNWSYSGGSYTIVLGNTCAAGFIQTSTNTTAKTATCTATTTTDFSGGEINARPVVLCNPNKLVGSKDATGTAYVINPACIAKPGTFDIGNLPRNFLRLPAIFNNDIAFFKNFRFGEKRGVQLRWEIYNVFNHTNFSDIFGAMAFGMDTGTPAISGACPSGFSFAPGSTTQCAGSTFGQVVQTNGASSSTPLGSPRTARSPRVMQASIRINF